MKIVQVVTEIAPFSYVGGMARGTFFLSQSLSKKNHDVRVITPFHYHVKKLKDNKVFPINRINKKLIIDKNKTTRIHQAKKSTKNEHTYFIDYPDFFSLRSNVYGYRDDYKRFYFFSIASLELLLYLKEKQNWTPDIIQCHDWHTGYLIELIKKNSRYKQLRNIKVLYTVHNFRYQNEMMFRYADPSELDDGSIRLGELESKKTKYQNSLIRGMLFADHVSTVSPNHAKEIILPEFSYNLVPIIKKINPKLSGILNGLNYDDFNPQTDPHIKHHFTKKNVIEHKNKNKKYLQKLFNLEQNIHNNLFCYVGRMTSQKGLELLLETIGEIIKNDKHAQFIALGEGEDRYCELMWLFKNKYPKQVGIKIKHDSTLPRQFFAGSDIFLMPSNYEPGGIAAIESLRYGCVPIVRETGGLKNIICDFSKNEKGNGFSFKKKTRQDFLKTINNALEIKNNKKNWKKLILNCLNYRHSWDDVSSKYEDIFNQMKNE